MVSQTFGGTGLEAGPQPFFPGRHCIVHHRNVHEKQSLLSFTLLWSVYGTVEKQMYQNHIKAL